MIRLTRLDGKEFILNSELIETLEQTPETVVTLTLDKRIVVKETVDEVLERIMTYKRYIFSDWPVKKSVRIPKANGDTSMFDWIEEDGIIETEELDQEKLNSHPVFRKQEDEQ